MIVYYKGAFGLNLLARIHGSAVYRALLPGLVSVGIYLAINKGWRKNQEEEDREDLNHPYAVGVFVSAVSFLIIFRANFAYGRYWEACADVFTMLSKWIDAATHTASYHMQCDHYDSIRPPSYYDYPQLKDSFLNRDRERMFDASEKFESDRLSNNSIERLTSINRVDSRFVKSIGSRNEDHLRQSIQSIPDDEPKPLAGKTRLDGGWEGFYRDDKTTFYRESDEASAMHHDSRGFASTAGGRAPPVFLQELAHLSSLLSAVALSTLRNDIEGAESPLTIYTAGAPWPPVNPGKLSSGPSLMDVGGFARHWLGFDRTPEARTKYNAAHPLPVVGGVSDGEIYFLQMARGPSAKTQLAWQWLSEFITREHLAGSFGEVGSPIISRVMQFLGDGMLGYNQARKIMFIPFPFPHAQLSAFSIILVTAAVPFMMEQYTNEVWLGALLSFFTVACLAGLHEVARELENPFRNVPNELPLVTLQAMFNESLFTMYSGYHPDAYFDHGRHIPRQRKRPGMREKSVDEQQKIHDSGVFAQGKLSINGSSDLAELKALVDKQSSDLASSRVELKRLRQLVEEKNERIHSTNKS